MFDEIIISQVIHDCIMMYNYIIKFIRLAKLEAGQKDGSEFQKWQEEMKQVCCSQYNYVHVHV